METWHDTDSNPFALVKEYFDNIVIPQVGDTVYGTLEYSDHNYHYFSLRPEAPYDARLKNEGVDALVNLLLMTEKYDGTKLVVDFVITKINDEQGVYTVRRSSPIERFINYLVESKDDPDVNQEQEYIGYVSEVQANGAGAMINLFTRFGVVPAFIPRSLCDDKKPELLEEKQLKYQLESYDPIRQKVVVTRKPFLPTENLATGSKPFKGLTPLRKIGDFVKNETIDCFITKVHPQLGLFVKAANSKVVGLVHINNFPNKSAENLTKYKVGANVKCKIVKVDKKHNRLSLTL